ncbi:arginyl-trna synthetase [Lichtheimia corymbifera JMRC:FSU:9682]|uniref:arginine--tRNA ligase n=1 Tax=Lichtheimia corymbifera JMRC:FSU:9682 TaxID=1263082 RepID=A0A068RQ07_9FUNG|nr:arginyl-trna synthetase [Lichtheimia corymbifera JMRC:FSU:9682]
MNVAAQFRKAIARRLAHISSCSEAEVLAALGTPKTSLMHQFNIPLPRVFPKDRLPDARDLADKFGSCDPLIADVSATGKFLNFGVRRTEYIKQTLQQVYQEKSSYGCHTQNVPQTVVIDYSSPNIAKPFHAGHLRSTIIGNFVKRINEAMGHRTIGINYLGDWGKQYGLLSVGFEKYGNEEELQKDPIHHLFQVYVRINSEKDELVEQQANAYFKRMEEGDPQALAQWRRLRELSIQSYGPTYQRLGIEFDRYSGESEAEPYLDRVYDMLQQRDLITVDTETGAWCVDLEEENLGRPIVRRADGTTLYLTRDLAIMLQRMEQYNFDTGIYVIGNDQGHYLQRLFCIAQKLDIASQLKHVSFGKVNGMSTRKGTVVFLDDILNTAQEQMEKNMRESGKYDELMETGVEKGNERLLGSEAVDTVADQLGASAVIVQDLASRRVLNYDFSYDRMTTARGYTGVFLQYTHARICGIERRTGVPITSDCDFSLLNEKEAFELSVLISQYPDIVELSWRQLEPCTLVQYLFKLAHSASQANAKLRIKDMDPKLAEARMLLLWSAKTTLANGLRLIGVEPLERM